MSISQRSAPPGVPTHREAVAAVVIAGSGGALEATLDAVASQVYGADTIFVVGGGEPEQRLTSSREASWSPDVAGVIDRLAKEIDLAWVVHDDVLPRPDALGALVSDLIRLEASVAGSKLLHADQPTVLESVGSATDVFDVPYSGLEEGEVDQQQYDVVRDVAFISAASMLVRRDLLRGLGGPDRAMAPEAASIDFSQRARAAGGRVIVVPSSEVMHTGTCRAGVPQWKEEAGRIRAMIKGYTWVTLLWSLPAVLVLGLIVAVARTFLGRPLALVDWVRAWVWNVMRFPSLMSGRRRVRRARLAGDAELFRYQVRGSAGFRELASDIGDRLRVRASDQVATGWSGLLERGQAFWQQPSFVAAILGVIFVALAARTVWIDRLPVVGFSLPVPESAWATLRSYAGGWNPAGLGSPFPLHPAVGAMGAIGLILFSKTALASTVVTIGSLGLGIAGTARLLRRLGVGATPRYVAGLVLVAGPASQFVLGEGYWPALAAVAAVPWAVGSALAPWPDRLRHKIGRVAAAALSTGIAGMFVPLTLLLPAASLLIWAILARPSDVRPFVRSLIPTLLAVPMLFPWLVAVSAGEIVESGRAYFWTPSWWLVGVFAVAAILVMVVADARTSAVAAWGAVLAAGGAWAARTVDLGWGREVSVLGMVAAALGSALVVGAALDAPTPLVGKAGARRALAFVAAGAGTVLALLSLLVLGDGRAGLPEDSFSETLEFTEARSASHGPDRILLIGPPETLPGDARQTENAAYRVVSAPLPSLAEAWLPAPRLGDDELAATLDGLLTGDTLRPGAELAPFGIRWVVVTGPSPLEVAFRNRLDMTPIQLELQVYENREPSPRAVASGGEAWRYEFPDYYGESEPAGRVYLAENGDRRWGSDWMQSGWGNEASAANGVVVFGGVAWMRSLAWLAGAAFALLILAVAVGRGGRA